MKEARNLTLGIPLASSNDFVKLRPNFDRRSVWYNAPKLFNLFIGNRNATDRPIVHPVKRTDPAKSIPDSMYHDLGSSGNPTLGGSRLVLIGRIRNVKREMEVALRITTVDLVNAFWSLHIAFLLFCAARILPKRNVICL